jgi:hypothetical protein
MLRSDIFRLSESMCMMCAQDAHRGAQKQRVACALTFLMCCHKEGDSMLSHIVTGDETWVFHITPESKHQFLHWQHDEDDLKNAVQKWLTSQAAAFNEEGIQKLVPRYDKCLNNGGEYVEKWFEECRI